MAEVANNVGTFRETVDRAIEVSRNMQRNQWQSGDLFAHITGLIFVSIDQGQPMPMLFKYHEGHTWAVVHPRMRVGQYAGQLAIISREGEDDQLSRQWSIESPLSGPMTAVNSERILSEPEEVEAAVNWAVSPHLHADVLPLLGRLTSEEEASVAAHYAEHETLRLDYEKDIAEIREAQRRAMQDAHKIFIS
jgi:hypothetical protein